MSWGSWLTLKTGDFRTYDVRGDGILAQKSGRTVYVIRHERVKQGGLNFIQFKGVKSVWYTVKERKTFFFDSD